MFKKFFGKKNDGFYMQVDESAPPKAIVAPKEVVAKAAVDAAKTDVVKESVAQSTAVAIAVEAAPTEQKNDKKAKSAKTSIKKDKKQEQDKKETAQPAVTAAPAVPAFTNFATDYLVTPAVAGNRRRPGANMKGFMSMARDVKEMKKGSQANQQKAAKKVEA